MKTLVRRSTLAFVVLLALAIIVWGGAVVPALAAGTTYYVDCSAAANGDGSQSNPWNNLDSVSATTFSPGDSVLLKRGATCTGTLWPKGSGENNSPITLGAYGTGALPVIDGDGAEYAVKLSGQQHWNVENLDVTGSTTFGILVTGTENGPGTAHILIADSVVHDVWGYAYTNKRSGLVSFLNGGGDHVFHDLLVDNVTAYNTNQWAGIEIWGGPWPINTSNPVFSDGVVFRNSTVHDIYADGIIIFETYNGVIENCVSYDTGIEPDWTVGTPNGIWTWGCWDCVVQYNECYRASSPGWDAGCYDIDYYSTNNTYQYNYGHDADGYCISVFGAGEFGTLNSIVRYNVCSNNVRDPRWAERQGDIFFMTWGGGWLDGAAVYNNTIYYNPVLDYAAVNAWFDYSGSGANFFKNNLIYSEVPSMVNAGIELEMDYNLYWYTGSGDPQFWYGGNKGNPTHYSGFDAYQAGGNEPNSIYADPKLNAPTYNGTGMPATAFTLQDDSPAIDAGVDVGSMGSQDFYGNSLPYNGVYDIGAHEWSGTVPTPTPAPTSTSIPPRTPIPTYIPLGYTHVEDIAMASGKYGGKYAAQVTVTILDENSDPVEAAEVSASFSGASNESVSGETDENGQVSFESARVRGGGTWTFCVDDVVKIALAYDESANVETCDSITAP